MMPLAAVMFVLATQNPPVPRLGVSDVQRLIRNDGPVKALAVLSDNEGQWDQLLKGVATGQTAWLSVGATLRSVSDAHASETLDMAIQEALPKNPTGVLGLLSRSVVTATDACGMYGFGQIEDGRPTTAILGLVDRRIKAVRNVRALELIAARDTCLVELRTLRRALQRGR
jgi:hypothetical protein